MATIRERWAGRWTQVVAGVAAAGGLAPLWFLPRLLELHGGAAFVVAWLALCLVLSLPLLWYELALGVVLQGAMPDALRRSHRRWEWLGWWASMVGVVVALLTLATAAVLGVHALRAVLAVTGGEISPMAPTDQAATASPQLGAAGLLATLAVAWLCTWLGGGGTARLGAVLNRYLAPAVGLVALAVIVGVAHAAGTAGFVRGFTPDWSQLLDTQTWLAAAGMATCSTLAGCGIYTACGSQRPRTSDVGGSALLILLVLVAVQLLFGAAVLVLVGRAALLAGSVAPDPDALVPLLVADPLAAVDPQAPWTGALAALAAAVGVGGLLVLGGGVLVHVLTTAWCDRTGDDRAPVARRLGWWLGAGALLLASPQGGWWLAAGCDGVVTWALLPLLALLSWAVVWHVGIDGLLDHTSAYSTIRPTTWWHSWLGVLVPVLLTALWWGRMLERWSGRSADLPWWMLAPVAIALLLLPLCALLWGRLGRGEGEVPPRRVGQIGIVALGLGLLVAVGSAIGTHDQRRSADDLRWLAERWLAEGGWSGTATERHPLTVARRAWSIGQIDIATGALELWAGQAGDEAADRQAAAMLADDIAADAMARLSVDQPRDVSGVLDALRLLRAMEDERALERVAAAWRVAAWVDAEAPALLRAAADALRAGDDGSDGLRRLDQRWRALVPEAEPASLVAWSRAPEPVGTAARSAVAALRDHATALPGRSDLSPRDRATSIAVLQEAGLWGQLPIEQRRWLAAAQLRSVQPGPALGAALALALGLLACIAVLLRRMVVGPGPIDPSADTLEHVDPVDVDSQAVTLEGEYTTDDATTTSGSRPVPSV